MGESVRVYCCRPHSRLRGAPTALLPHCDRLTVVNTNRAIAWAKDQLKHDHFDVICDHKDNKRYEVCVCSSHRAKRTDSRSPRPAVHCHLLRSRGRHLQEHDRSLQQASQGQVR